MKINRYHKNRITNIFGESDIFQILKMLWHWTLLALKRSICPNFFRIGNVPLLSKMWL